MASPRVLVLRAPGTNCDEETAYAFERAGGFPERVHVNRLLEKPAITTDFQILCIPGGFSYGDDIAAGRILAGQIQRELDDSFQQFKDDGKLILGICNGFQVLLKSGVLLEDDEGRNPLATLNWNKSGRYEDRWVNLNVDGQKCVFLQGIESMYLPVAHAEGRFEARDVDTLGGLQTEGQLVLRYGLPGGNPTNESVDYPFNPNGSIANVAGVCDATGRVFGLMPHPERFTDPTHHPRWTRDKTESEGDGLAVFRNAVAHC